MPDDTAAPVYRQPSPPMVDLIDAPGTPGVSLSPDRRWLCLQEPLGLPSIEEVGRPELRLAGLRIDPVTYGPSRSNFAQRLVLLSLSTGEERPVTGLPDEPRLQHLQFSPDSRWLVCTQTSCDGIQPWRIEVATAEARPLAEVRLNATYGWPLNWLPDSSGVLATLVPSELGAPPEPPAVPAGPAIQENDGRVAPNRTYQDLLRNRHDDALFTHYVTCQPARLDLAGNLTSLGAPDLIRRLSPSPDGQWLLVDTILPPFSRLVQVDRFAHAVDVRRADGRRHYQLCELPLAESVPLAFDACTTGPRAVTWRSDADATLTWVEALDQGDPAVEANPRDRLFQLAAPFDGEPQTLAEFSLRFRGDLAWTADGRAVATESWWKTRRTKVWLLEPERGADPKLLWARSFEDRYSDPGRPMVQRTAQGRWVLLTLDDGRSLVLSGDGASESGDRPFLARFDLETLETTRLWRSEPPWYERASVWLDPAEPIVLTCRESQTAQPDYYLRNLETGELRQVTHLPNPAPGLERVHKEQIRYQRADGVDLTATLYLPPGKSAEDGPFPTVLWAYPREFKSAAAAGQVTDSPHRYIRVAAHSPLHLLLAGYAVLDGPTLPIIGEGEAEANDTYVEQLGAGARAAVSELLRRGVAEPGRIAVGGHSYGAFMTANLLAHTDLFAAGIARSGAYNRTLTPFGFQAEERTLWQAPEVYAAMSPFQNADRVKSPLLLIHGEADNNSGTFPMQSERLYNALKGHGAICRLVLLPHESHGYRARESVLHQLWEIEQWLGRFIKDGETAPAG